MNPPPDKNPVFGDRESGLDVGVSSGVIAGETDLRSNELNSAKSILPFPALSAFEIIAYCDTINQYN